MVVSNKSHNSPLWQQDGIKMIKKTNSISHYFLNPQLQMEIGRILQEERYDKD
jgi:hypothetical protein